MPPDEYILSICCVFMWTGALQAMATTPSSSTEATTYMTSDQMSSVVATSQVFSTETKLTNMSATPSSGDVTTTTGMSATPSSGDVTTATYMSATPSSGDVTTAMDMSATPSSGDVTTATGMSATPSPGDVTTTTDMSATPSSGDVTTATGMSATPSSGDVTTATDMSATPSSGDVTTPTDMSATPFSGIVTTPTDMSATPPSGIATTATSSTSLIVTMASNMELSSVEPSLSDGPSTNYKTSPEPASLQTTSLTQNIVESSFAVADTTEFMSAGDTPTANVLTTTDMLGASSQSTYATETVSTDAASDMSFTIPPSDTTTLASSSPGSNLLPSEHSVTENTDSFQVSSAPPGMSLSESDVNVVQTASTVLDADVSTFSNSINTELSFSGIVTPASLMTSSSTLGTSLVNSSSENTAETDSVMLPLSSDAIYGSGYATESSELTSSYDATVAPSLSSHPTASLDPSMTFSADVNGSASSLPLTPSGTSTADTEMASSFALNNTIATSTITYTTSATMVSSSATRPSLSFTEKQQQLAISVSAVAGGTIILLAIMGGLQYCLFRRRMRTISKKSQTGHGEQGITDIDKIGWTEFDDLRGMTMSYNKPLAH